MRSVKTGRKDRGQNALYLEVSELLHFMEKGGLIKSDVEL